MYWDMQSWQSRNARRRRDEECRYRVYAGGRAREILEGSFVMQLVLVARLTILCVYICIYVRGIWYRSYASGVRAAGHSLHRMSVETDFAVSADRGYAAVASLPFIRFPELYVFRIIGFSLRVLPRIALISLFLTSDNACRLTLIIILKKFLFLADQMRRDIIDITAG